jgi:cyclase
MLRPRITPCLLVSDGGLVKTVGFKDPKYVGDPINAVKIFNEKEADELIVLDIDASVKGAAPNLKLISNLAAECRMPLCYGGGIKTAEQAREIIALGVEKVAIASAAVESPSLVAEIASAVGTQSVVVVLDVIARSFGRYEVVTHNATRRTGLAPTDFARRVAEMGAGEVVINSVTRDGQMKGYDLALAKAVREVVNIPMTVLGGAGNLEHIRELIRACGVVGAAAGSMFVFKGAYRAVLINYPNAQDKAQLTSVVQAG